MHSMNTRIQNTHNVIPRQLTRKLEPTMIPPPPPIPSINIQQTYEYRYTPLSRHCSRKNKKCSFFKGVLT